MMKSYATLGTKKRNDPCQEYPGVYLVYVKGEEVYGSRDFNHAKAVAHRAVVRLGRSKGAEVSVCWEASEDDPRIGHSWFTGFFRVGKFNQFGRFVEA